MTAASDEQEISLKSNETRISKPPIQVSQREIKKKRKNTGEGEKKTLLYKQLLTNVVCLHRQY